MNALFQAAEGDDAKFLCLATRIGDTEFVEFLLEKDPELCRKNQQQAAKALSFATEDGNVALINLIINAMRT